MRRKITRPTTAKCNLLKYIGFLLCEPKLATCTLLNELSDMLHDSVNYFLQREKFTPNTLFLEVAAKLILKVERYLLMIRCWKNLHPLHSVDRSLLLKKASQNLNLRVRLKILGRKLYIFQDQ